MNGYQIEAQVETELGETMTFFHQPNERHAPSRFLNGTGCPVPWTMSAQNVIGSFEETAQWQLDKGFRERPATCYKHGVQNGALDNSYDPFIF
jgi:hypothetical protein